MSQEISSSDGLVKYLVEIQAKQFDMIAKANEQLTAIIHQMTAPQPVYQGPAAVTPEDWLKRLEEDEKTSNRHPEWEGDMTDHPNWADLVELEGE